MMRFGGTVTLNGVVVHAAYNVDKILLGRVWGAEVTGIYGRAYQLINLPIESLNLAVGAVTFPILARLQADPQRLRTYFLKVYALVLSATIPVVIVCALFANELVLVMLGSQWTGAAPVFRLLAPTVLAFALINPTGWLLVSLGLVERSLKLALVIAPLVVIGCVVGLPHGPKGVALGFSAAMVFWVVPHLLWTFHGTVVSYQDVLRVVSRPLLAGIAGAVAAGGFMPFVGGALPPFLRLVFGCSVLFSVYAWVLLVVMAQKPVYVDLLRSLKTRSPDGALAST
jgi:PST family polysaccharide transporter